MAGGRDARRAVDVEADVASPPAIASPVCRPIRTRTAVPSGHGSAASARCAVDGGSDRRRALSNDDEEGVALGALLVAAVRPRTRLAGSRGGAPGARRSASVPSSCSSRVEPSMSVNRNVTVPVVGPPAVRQRLRSSFRAVAQCRALRSASRSRPARTRRIASATLGCSRDHRFEVPGRERQAAWSARSLTTWAIARPAVEDRQLAEELARPEASDRLPVADRPRRSR